MKRVWTLWLAVIAVMFIVVWLATQLFFQSDGAGSDRSVRIKMQMDGSRKRIDLQRDVDGELRFLVQRFDGKTEALDPEQFAQMLYDQQMQSGFFAKLFNISSPLGMIWVGVGLLGQLLFTGRMLVQWLVSEKKRQSVVPTAFWWLSVIGAGMLLAYFLWRRDIVGVLGQSFGLIIYVRNLHLIYAAKRAAMNVPIGQTAAM